MAFIKSAMNGAARLCLLTMMRYSVMLRARACEAQAEQAGREMRSARCAMRRGMLRALRHAAERRADEALRREAH